MSKNQQLAAIMFTDIVGFTTLMGQDVEKGLELLRKNRLIQKPLIEKHNGKWLKEMGDGVLAQFGSAIDSVQCALEIQKLAKTDLNAKIRIGIHLGDVTTENEDVFGDGVNIASRIQSIADPGGIYITESIHDAIRARSTVISQYIGELRLKNVDHLVKTYYLVHKALPVPTKKKRNELLNANKPLFQKLTNKYMLGVLAVLIALTAWWISNKSTGKIQSIAIMPIHNLTGNSDDDWLERGVYEGIYDAIGKIQKLRVVSRTTVMKTVKNDLTIPEIAEALNVDGIIEASYTKNGNNLSVQARLIKAFPEERQVWNDGYDKAMNNVLFIYKEIAKSIADNSNIELSSQEEKVLSNSYKVDPRAYQAYVTGLVHLESLSVSSLERAMEYFEQALEYDPDFALAYSGISWVWGAHIQNGNLPYSVAGPKAEEASLKALSLDSTEVDIRWRLAASYTWREWNFEKAGKEFENLFRQNPNHPMALAYYSHYLSYLDRAEEGLTYGEKAIALRPQNMLYKSIHSMALKNIGKYDEALELLLNILKTAPDEPIAIPALWAVYHEKEMYEDAFEMASKRYAIKNDIATVKILEDSYAEGGYKHAMRRTAEAMIVRRDSVFVPSWQIATLYSRASMKNEAINWLSKAYDDHDPNMPYIKVDPLFDELRSDDRFKELIKKMNYPN